MVKKNGMNNMKNFDTYINESIFNETFEERIDHLNALFFENRKIFAEIISNEKLTKVVNKYYINLSLISKLFVSILMKYKFHFTQDQINIIKEKWNVFEKCFKVIPFTDFFYINIKKILNNILIRINQTLSILRLLGKKFDMEGVTLYDENGKINSYQTHTKKGYTYLITDSNKKLLRDQQLAAHADVDPYGEENWEV